MPLFINRDQIFAHQVHLLEHKLRGKEERILELETENAILHIRLAESMAKLEEEPEVKNSPQIEEKNTRLHSAVVKLISEVKTLKQCLSEFFAVYVSFATELEEKSKQLQEIVEQKRCSYLRECSQDTVDSLQTRLSALERSLEEEREKFGAERQRRKELHNALVELRGNIRVHCRLRPLLPFDDVRSYPSSSGPDSSERVIQAVSDDTVVVNCMKAGVPAQNKMFEFERVYGPDDSQETVFEEVKPLLTSLLDGYNVCIMAYGQTGSGKTHTMMGSPESDEPSGLRRGVIVMAATEIFRLISEKPSASYTVEMSVTEVYNNDVSDLLAKDAGRRRENVTSTSQASFTQEIMTYQLHVVLRSVCDASEVVQIMSRVLRLRAHCSTLVHADSSRSHIIVTLTISSKSPNAQALARRLQSAKKRESWSPKCRRANAMRNSPEEGFQSPASSPSLSPCPSPRLGASQSPFKTKLQLVDLAGSECVDMTGVSGGALWEVSCINRSLSALSDVLAALAEQRPHVPYRNSKLTHLLQDVIGGDAKLLVMLCVSPTRRFITESLQTLAFGARARQVHRDPARKKSNTLKVK
nr:kinesin-like protein KIF25 [Nerophis lumbriciformis]